ncbi:MAG: 4-(cytidine 5'-diphospho)-2-C-methyl-D-erythritol kinase [Lachnospiraceae bacterium]|nr:4-(cytidine 5'-diphospho)-2-C-methyl-D-erythritol kinase [Lachnospiraceae bacterium]
MDQLRKKAYGKINLALDVIGRRDDGYHLVKMIMQTVELHDELSFEKTTDGSVSMTTNDSTLPVNDDNLCIKAAKLLKDEFHLTEGVNIHLEKNIPVAAGMAGGSTDAAAVLKAVNEMFELGLSDEDLMERGLSLGADIPYCIMGGTALSEGIGEELTKISPMPKVALLIAKPPVNVSTGKVYTTLDSLESYEHPDIDGMVRSIEEKNIKEICNTMGNVLADVTMPMVKEVEQLRDTMLSFGADGAMMTGSGPTVFGIFTDEVALDKCYLDLKEKNVCERLYKTFVL